MSREQLEAVAQSLAVRLEELEDEVDQSDDDEAPGESSNDFSYLSTALYVTSAFEYCYRYQRFINKLLLLIIIAIWGP